MTSFYDGSCLRGETAHPPPISPHVTPPLFSSSSPNSTAVGVNPLFCATACLVLPPRVSFFFFFFPMIPKASRDATPFSLGRGFSSFRGDDFYVTMNPDGMAGSEGGSIDTLRNRSLGGRDTIYQFPKVANSKSVVAILAILNSPDFFSTLFFCPPGNPKRISQCPQTPWPNAQNRPSSRAIISHFPRKWEAGGGSQGVLGPKIPTVVRKPATTLARLGSKIK